MINLSLGIKALYGISTGLIILATMAVYNSPNYAQSPGWTIHNSNNCLFSIDYPSNWTIQEKQNRFDTSDELKISSNNGSIPFLTVTACKEETNLDSLSLTDLTNTGKELLIGTYHDTYEVTVVEDTRIEKSRVGGQDAGVFTVMTKYTFPGIPTMGEETYIVKHGNRLYGFAYFDFANHFDSAESKQIRERMLHSVKFLN